MHMHMHTTVHHITGVLLHNINSSVFGTTAVSVLVLYQADHYTDVTVAIYKIVYISFRVPDAAACSQK